jgi:hypothetical protein
MGAKPKRLPDWATADPLRALGLLALVAYVELLIPTQLFYRTLETTPGAAGLEGIDVLLQQGALVLATYALVSAVGVTGYFVLAYPFVIVRKSTGGRRRAVAAALSAAAIALGLLMLALGYAASLGIDGSTVAIVGGALLVVGFSVPRIVAWGDGPAHRVARWEALRQSRAVAIYGLAIGAAGLLLFSIAWAIPYANQIKKGNAPDDFLFPWQARHVQAIWEKESPPMRLPRCEALIYLGEDDGRVLLYDSNAERALRIVSSDLQLSLPEACAEQTG